MQNCVNISINSADVDSISVYNQRSFFCVQERLLLSILPKHIADEMLQDMKKEASQKEMQQFNTMYMYRHENVRSVRDDYSSVMWLFADCLKWTVFVLQYSVRRHRGLHTAVLVL